MFGYLQLRAPHLCFHRHKIVISILKYLGLFSIGVFWKLEVESCAFLFAYWEGNFFFIKLYCGIKIDLARECDYDSSQDLANL